MKGRITKDGFEQSQLLVSEEALKGKASIHRDYLAHVYRWQYVVKILAKGERHKSTYILDVGCGYDIPLYRILTGNRRGPAHYTGVDIAKIREPDYHCSTPRTLLSHTPIHTVEAETYNFITCFEMLEHVPLEYAKKTLKHLHSISTSDATLVLSTPVFNEKVGMANNHINEMTRECLMDMMREAGWTIIHNYGTFASQRDYKPHLTHSELELYMKLAEYHHVDVLATIFAPLYPEHSRNNLWVCEK